MLIINETIYFSINLNIMKIFDFLKNKFAAENLFEFNRSIDQKLPDVNGILCYIDKR